MNKLNKLGRRILSIVLTVALVVGLMPNNVLTVRAATTAHDISTGSLEISSNGDYTITGSTTSNTVTVKSGVTANVTLNGVKIDCSNTGITPIMVESGAILNLTLIGDNVLTACTLDYKDTLTTQQTAALGVPVGAELVITESSTGTLTANGANGGGAGIGGGYNGSCGTITINGGTINANGGWTSGAGIGGGAWNNENGTITINGGTVNTTSTDGAGIGAGGGEKNCSGTITINGGTINATSTYGAGIGNSSNGSGVTVTITGGNINCSSVSAPTNGTSAVACYTFKFLSNSVDMAGKTVSAITLDGNNYEYNFNDVVTLDGGSENEGYLKLYLPEGSNVTSITVDNTTYTCRSEDGTCYTDHDWEDATCGVPKTCKACGKTEGEPTGNHSWVDATCAVPKTCKACGKTEGEPTGNHSWVDATCMEVKHCSVCGKTEGERANHTYENGVCTLCGIDEQGTFHIKNSAQLEAFAQYVSEGNKNTNAVLEANIDMSDVKDWTPIGQTISFHLSGAEVTDTGYTGTFNGNGHVITGLTVSGISGDTYSYGLFGTVSGTVKHLGMDGFIFTMGSASDARAGSVAGQVLTGGTIENCYSIKHSVTTNNNIAGGIAGCNYGGTIRNCYAYNGSVSGFDTRWGGVVGDCQDDGNADAGTVTDCYTDAKRVVSTQNDSTKITNCEVKDASAFASGEVTYKLNGSTSDGDLIWYQTLEIDEMPKFSGDTVVYQNGSYINHVHEWIYSSEKTEGSEVNNKIVATCTVGGCTREATFSVAEEIIRTGSPIELVVDSNTLTEEITITYTAIEGSLTDGKPVNVGTYKAEVSITGADGNKAGCEFEYEIVPAFIVTGGALGTDYTYEDGVLTILSSTPITIANKDPETPTKDRIVVKKDVSANIFLAGVNIKVAGYKIENLCAFKIEDDSNGQIIITLKKDTKNTLYSSTYCAGLQKNGKNGSLTITGEGTLIAIGNYQGAGIGGGAGGAGTNIRISGGTVTAEGASGAGIGGGYEGAGTNIEISGGVVEATGGYDGAGIGGGDGGAGANIRISGGTVTARGGDNGAGIGGGTGVAGTNITISGGVVEAIGGDDGAGIGGGTHGPGTNIEISGGTVTAQGGYSGAGIGGGADVQTYTNYGYASNITISGGTVTAQGGNDGAGIGGGAYSVGSEIKITGGSVKAVAGTDANSIGGGYKREAVCPTLADGTTPVYLFELEVDGESNVTIDEQAYPVKHFKENKLYVYLSATDHTVVNGDSKVLYKWNEENTQFIPALAAWNFIYTQPTGFVYTGEAAEIPDDIVVSKTTGIGTVSGIGTISVKYYDEQDNLVDVPTKAGTYHVKIDVSAGDKFGAQEGITDESWTFEIAECPHTLVGEDGICEDCDYYLIANAENLMWFVKQVNEGQTAINAKLTADIDMKDIDWTIMSSFAGTFDGDGHTILYLCADENGGDDDIADGSRCGLFQTLSVGGTVTNLTISGAQLWSENSAGAIVAVNNGTISKCIVKDSSIMLGASHGLAAIAGTNTGTVTDCGVVNCFLQRRYSAANSNTFAIGAVVEDNSGTVSNCFSYGCTFSNSPNLYAIVESGNAPVNCYYYTDATVSDTVATAKTADQFASGEVAYLLNGEKTDGTQSWYQTLKTDTYPVPDNTHGKVYYGYISCSENAQPEYSNQSHAQETKPDHVEGKDVFFTLDGEIVPTCTERGVGHTECEKCHKVMQTNVTVEASGHTGGTATCKNKAECSVCHEGYGELDKNNHAGETEVKDAREATCAVEGYTGDTYCKDCGAKIATGTVIPKSTIHTWDEGIVTKEPTPLEKGEKTHTCTVCKATKTEEIAALGAPEVGTKDTSDDGKATYKVTKSDLKKGTVTYVAPRNKKATTVIIPATVEIDGVKYSVTAIEKNAFKNNKYIKSVSIGKNVKTVGASAFYKCRKLKTVKFGSNIVTIGDKAFYKCTALTKISLPSKLKTIGKSAFYGCKKVTAITIGKSVERIGEKAFYGCSKVKTITIKTTKLTTKKIGNKAFAKTQKSVTVKIPKKKFATYKSMLIKKGVNKKAKFKKF